MSLSQRTGVVLSLWIVVVVFSVVLLLVYSVEEQTKKHKSIFDHGKYSRDAGVSSEANPWRGRRGTHWLDGWAEGNPQ